MVPGESGREGTPKREPPQRVPGSTLPGREVCYCRRQSLGAIKLPALPEAVECPSARTDAPIQLVPKAEWWS
eukprot:2063678-Rhodomonas_salina.1